MPGYFKPDMTEAEQRALSATLDQATRDKLLADALALVPKCETPAFTAAVQYQPAKATGYTAEQVQTIADGWIGDYDKMQSAYDALKPCPPKDELSTAEKVGIGGMFTVFVVLVVRAFKGPKKR